MELKAPVGMNACGGICIMIRIVGVKVTIGTEVTVFVLSGMKGLSNSLAASRVPKAADGGCFLGICARKWRLGQWRKPALIALWHL